MNDSNCLFLWVALLGALALVRFRQAGDSIDLPEPNLALDTPEKSLSSSPAASGLAAEQSTTASIHVVQRPGGQEAKGARVHAGRAPVPQLLAKTGVTTTLRSNLAAFQAQAPSSCGRRNRSPSPVPPRWRTANTTMSAPAALSSLGDHLLPPVRPQLTWILGPRGARPKPGLGPRSCSFSDIETGCLCQQRLSMCRRQSRGRQPARDQPLRDQQPHRTSPVRVTAATPVARAIRESTWRKVHAIVLSQGYGDSPASVVRPHKSTFVVDVPGTVASDVDLFSTIWKFDLAKQADITQQLISILTKRILLEDKANGVGLVTQLLRQYNPPMTSGNALVIPTGRWHRPAEAVPAPVGLFAYDQKSKTYFNVRVTVSDDKIVLFFLLGKFNVGKPLVRRYSAAFVPPTSPVAALSQGIPASTLPPLPQLSVG